jgi:hypothetical protein
MQPSAPEVKVRYKTAGRDTMAAIEEELQAPGLGTTEAPLIEISEAPAGRETMAAIAEELASEMRPRQNTLPYDDKVSNAPGAKSPSRTPAPIIAPAPLPARAHKAPAISVEGEVVPGPPPRLAADGVQIFELLTFIIRGNTALDLSTDARRRQFVAEHLLHRLPSRSLDDVERIEVTPWTAKGTMVLRLWCKA